jgi:ferric-dicitrate binding protein FerR (iron transport regulator)
MKPSDDKQLFFDMQEHPEKYSDEQLEAMMTELDKEPDAEVAWQKVLSNSPLKEENSFPLRKGRGWSSLRRVVAIITAFAFLGIISLAGYHSFFYKTSTDNRQQTTDTTAVRAERFYVDVQDGDTIFRFENIRLDSILAVVSRHYERRVVFKDKAPAHLRLYLTCYTTQTLEEFVETLNMFDGINVTQEFYMLYVESDEKKEGKQ